MRIHIHNPFLLLLCAGTGIDFQATPILCNHIISKRCAHPPANWRRLLSKGTTYRQTRDYRKLDLGNNVGWMGAIVVCSHPAIYTRRFRWPDCSNWNEVRWYSLLGYLKFWRVKMVWWTQLDPIVVCLHLSEKSDKILYGYLMYPGDQIINIHALLQVMSLSRHLKQSWKITLMILIWLCKIYSGLQRFKQ